MKINASDYKWDGSVLHRDIEHSDGTMDGAKLKENGKWIPVVLPDGDSEWEEWEEKTGEFDNPIEAIERVPYFWC
jgi:hypothetical protein